MRKTMKMVLAAALRVETRETAGVYVGRVSSCWADEDIRPSQLCPSPLFPLLDKLKNHGTHGEYTGIHKFLRTAIL